MPRDVEKCQLLRSDVRCPEPAARQRRQLAEMGTAERQLGDTSTWTSAFVRRTDRESAVEPRPFGDSGLRESIASKRSVARTRGSVCEILLEKIFAYDGQA
jgi:hypothetical protein